MTLPRSRLRARSLAVLPLLLVLGAPAQSQRGGDWPQWRGPERNGVSRETGLLKEWPQGGPRLAWRAAGLGGGFTAPSIAGGRVYGMGYRGGNEAVWALDQGNGKPAWSARLAKANTTIGRQGASGPHSTPTVVGNRVYVLGISGDLACLDAATGKVVWQKNLVRDFGGKVPAWGYSESPLVDGDRVIATPGGKSATLVALDRNTGAMLWKAKVPQGDPAQYSSAIIADPGGQRQYVQFLKSGVVGVRASDGRFLWRYDHPANPVANIATPIYRNGLLFAASGYENGGGMAQLVATANGTSAKEVYFTKRMRNHHGGVVQVGEYLYGFDNANLTCLKWGSGQEAWSNRSVGKGSLVYADGCLYVRGERGPVALVQASGQKYVEKGRFNPPDRNAEPAWSHPVVAGGRLYLRDQGVLLCYDVKAR